MDVNAVLEGKMDYSAFEQTMLEPVLRWMYRAVLAEQGIDMQQVLPNADLVDDLMKDITGLASDGDHIEHESAHNEADSLLWVW